MRARLLQWLADAWWRGWRRPAPWTWRARQEAVRTAEEWLHDQSHGAPGHRHAHGGAGKP